MIYSYNKPSELLARQKQTGESYWDMIGNPLPKYDNGKSKWYSPSQKVRKGIASWEGSHFAGQNKQFGGDAIGAKAAELNVILNNYGLTPEMIPQGLYDALVSQYYNISPKTFKNYTGKYLQSYSKNQNLLHYNMLRDAVKDRYKLSPEKYRNGIRKRTDWEYRLIPEYEIWNGSNTAKQQQENTLETPVDATKVVKPQIVPEKIPYNQPISYQYEPSSLPDIMQAYQRITNGQMPLQTLNSEDYGYDDYTEA